MAKCKSRTHAAPPAAAPAAPPAAAPADPFPWLTDIEARLRKIVSAGPEDLAKAKGHTTTTKADTLDAWDLIVRAENMLVIANSVRVWTQRRNVPQALHAAFVLGKEFRAATLSYERHQAWRDGEAVHERRRKGSESTKKKYAAQRNLTVDGQTWQERVDFYMLKYTCSYSRAIDFLRAELRQSGVDVSHSTVKKRTRNPRSRGAAQK